MKVKLISALLYAVARSLAATLRLQVLNEDRIEATRKQYGGAILVSWHGRTFIGITNYRARGYWAMISTSRDGEYQNEIFHMFGFNTVRGSTSARGAVASALKMAKALKDGAVLAHTPDGPRGPLHAVHPGAIFLAEKSGCPIIPVGVSANPRLLLETWDHYLVPLPFARAVMIYGDPIVVPKDIDDAGRKHYCDLLGEKITELEAQAESIALGSKRAPAMRTNES